MSLQSASTAKTASDANVSFNDVTTASIMTDIDAKITIERDRTDSKNVIYQVIIDLEADLDTTDGVPDILKSGQSNVSLMDIKGTLKAAGYTTSCRSIKTRDGINNQVKLQVAWGP